MNVSLIVAGSLAIIAAAIHGVGGEVLVSPPSLLRHPAPVALTAIAALAWWGAL